jgi:hypothetical protein
MKEGSFKIKMSKIVYPTETSFLMRGHQRLKRKKINLCK